MVTGRTKGMTLRAKGNVVLVAAQLDDPDGNPTEQYVLLRADEFGRLRTIDAGAAATFLGLTDTPASYVGQGGLILQINVGETAVEFAEATHIKAVPFDTDLVSWVQPGWASGTQSTGAATVDRLYYVPIYLERAITYTGIGCHVTALAAGAVARLGIYAATFDAAGQMSPGALTLDAGTVSVAAAGQKSIVIAQTLAAGWHFLALSSDGAPTLVTPHNGSATGAPVTAIREQISQGGRTVSSVAVVDGAAALPDPAPAASSQETAQRAFVMLGATP